MSGYDETKHVRGKNPANVGQYSTKDYAEAEGVDLDALPEDDDGYVLTGTMWKLPPWDEIDLNSEHDSEAVRLYAKETARRMLRHRGVFAEDGGYLSRGGGAELHLEGLEDDITQDVMQRLYQRAKKSTGDRSPIRSSGDFVGGVVKRCIAERLRGSRESSADQIAGRMLADQVTAFEQEHGRKITNRERDALASEIRRTWDRQKRKPSVNFHKSVDGRFHEDVGAADQLGLVGAIGLDGTSNGSGRLLHVETRRRSRIMAERRAAEVYAKIVDQASAKLGRDLTDAERRHVASRVISHWRPGDPARPRPNFLDYSTTHSGEETDKWSQAVYRLTSPEAEKPTVSKRMANMIAWNALAEQSDAPLAARASISSGEATKLRKEVAEAGGPAVLAQQWEDGDRGSATRALFAPYEIHADADREAIVAVLIRNPRAAESLWSSATAIASVRNRRSMETLGI
jgi:hypothetical protein